MSRYRVLEVSCDDSFGYVPNACECVIADQLTRAEAKSIYKHYINEQWKAYLKGDTLWFNSTDYILEVLTDDGYWHDVSKDWAYIGYAEQEEWFENMGWDYEAWQMNTKEEPYDFKNGRC